MNNTIRSGYSIYIITGEESGDILGAQLIRALKLKYQKDIHFIGVGGLKMAAEGHTSLFPITELSVMGLAEVIPRIPKILNLINQTVSDIIKQQPNVIITIDAPDFCFRIARRLKGKGIPLIHYVAPSVWAWRPNRAKKVANLFDHLISILPFEPPYFQKYGLQTSFVGHPVVQSLSYPANPISFREQLNIPSQTKIIILLPGSRTGEVKRHLPIFKETIIKLARKIRDIHIICLVTENTKFMVSKSAKTWSFTHSIIHEKHDKLSALASGNVALAASGTVALELACAGTPSIITYKINPVSAWVARKMVKISYANIVNLLLKREAIPEFIQKKCNPHFLCKALFTLLNEPQSQIQQRLDYSEALNFLKLSDIEKKTPSDHAAEVITKYIEK